MYSHAPTNYNCQFCRIGSGEDIEGPWVKQSDIVYRGAALAAFISPHWWPNNRGHVVIIPRAHYENLYSMPDDLLGQVAILSRQIALALRAAYDCDGTSVRQHNEPAGGQDMWHYHYHVFPRFAEDNLYFTRAQLTTPEERQPYAERLRRVLATV